VELRAWVTSHHLPEDEYDGLVPALVRLLEGGASVESLASHLRNELGPDLGTDVVDDPGEGVQHLAARLRTGVQANE
jgi:hypothetical protein